MREMFPKVKTSQFLNDFPVYKVQQNRKENGDVFELHVELKEDEKVDFFKVGSSPDAFADAIDRLPDVSLIERFDAVAQLDAAIAQIQYSPSNLVENEEK